MKISIKRVLKYCWFYLVMCSTSWLPDIRLVLRLRGFLARPAFKKCGSNLQIASGVKMIYTANAELGDNIFIGNYCWIAATAGLDIEDDVLIGPFVVIATGDHISKGGSARFGGAIRGPVKLCRGCWLAAHVVLTRGVTVGAGAIVGANAVVTHDVAAGTVCGGVPARQISDQAKEYKADPTSIGR